MLSVDDFLKRAAGRARVFGEHRVQTGSDVTDRLTVCIPDMHLLEKGPDDDFYDSHAEYETRFLDLLDFLNGLRETEKGGIEIIQLGDMYDLWQAKGNTNLVVEAYPNEIGLLDQLGTVFVIGNHDIDLYQWYKSSGQTFNRGWRYFSKLAGTPTVIYEHGFQADFANNQGSWSGKIGRKVTEVVGMMEYLYPDIDIRLGAIWDSISGVFAKYNESYTPTKQTGKFDYHQYRRFYVDLMEKYNRGEVKEEDLSTNLSVAVVAHTHSARMASETVGARTYHLMDCGSWVNGGHEIGLLSGNDIAICQWG